MQSFLNVYQIIDLLLSMIAILLDHWFYLEVIPNVLWGIFNQSTKSQVDRLPMATHTCEYIHQFTMTGPKTLYLWGKKWGVRLARSEAIFPLQNGRMYAKSWRKAKLV